MQMDSEAFMCYHLNLKLLEQLESLHFCGAQLTIVRNSFHISCFSQTLLKKIANS